LGKFEFSKSSVFAFADENLGDCRDELNGRRGLWAKRRFLKFARKMQIPVTGKMSILEICP